MSLRKNAQRSRHLVAEHGLAAHASALRRNAMACVALPTCGLALAESERYLPSLVTALEERLAANGLADDEIVIRMTGCPNGCARTYLAEIGLVGKGPGRYNLYLGAAFDGSRLSKLYAEDLDQAAIIAKLDSVFAAYAAESQTGGTVWCFRDSRRLRRADHKRRGLSQEHRSTAGGLMSARSGDDSTRSLRSLREPANKRL